MAELELKVDRWMRLTLGAIVAVLAMIALGVWGNQNSMMPAAHAQIPDSGRQRNLLLEETRKTNLLLHEILDHLQHQAIKVETKPTDDAKGR